MNRYCPKCFTELPENASYCPTCGECMRGKIEQETQYIGEKSKVVTIGLYDKAIRFGE